MNDDFIETATNLTKENRTYRGRKNHFEFWSEKDLDSTKTQ